MWCDKYRHFRFILRTEMRHFYLITNIYHLTAIKSQILVGHSALIVPINFKILLMKMLKFFNKDEQTIPYEFLQLNEI